MTSRADLGALVRLQADNWARPSHLADAYPNVKKNSTVRRRIAYLWPSSRWAWVWIVGAMATTRGKS